MRDYCLHEASSRAAYGRLTWVVRVWSNWRMRKTLKQLSKLADHQLYDIGLPRDVLNQLITIPLSRDLAWDYERKKMLEACHGTIPAKLVQPEARPSPHPMRAGLAAGLLQGKTDIAELC